MQNELFVVRHFDTTYYLIELLKLWTKIDIDEDLEESCSHIALSTGKS